MPVKIILVFSILLQVAAAAKAISLVKPTGIRFAWLMFISGLCLMSFRRIFTLLFQGDIPSASFSLILESSGLLLSGCILVGVWGIGTIILERRKAEAAVRVLLDEKKLLLREVHHRIKNNLATAISLLRLQKDASPDPRCGNAIEEAAGRLHSMYLLYEQVYCSQNYAHLPISEYLGSIIPAILDTFDTPVRPELSVEPLRLGIHQSFLLGIFVTEALTNSLKHAAGGNRLELKLYRSEDTIRLSVRDAGPGFPAELHRQGSLGILLMESIATQLGGRLELANSAGAEVRLDFPVSGAGG